MLKAAVGVLNAEFFSEYHQLGWNGWYIDCLDPRRYDADLPKLMLFQLYRGIAQPGSALALGARCRGFKSLYPDQVSEL